MDKRNAKTKEKANNKLQRKKTLSVTDPTYEYRKINVSNYYNSQ